MEELRKTGCTLYTDDFTIMFNKITDVLGANNYFSFDEHYKNFIKLLLFGNNSKTSKNVHFKDQEGGKRIINYLLLNLISYIDY